MKRKNITKKEDIYVKEATCFLRWMSLLTRVKTMHFPPFVSKNWPVKPRANGRNIVGQQL